MRKFISIAALCVLGLAVVGAWWWLGREDVNERVVLGMDCGVNALGLEWCQRTLADFAEETGYDVTYKNSPDSSSLHNALLRELSLTRSDDVDVYSLDVVWPGSFADDLLDLNPYFTDAELEDFFPRILENNSVGDKLLAIPSYADAGLLYYRRDLLNKYGFDAPPQNWDELERMARTIQTGERNEGNPDFWGYVWQGAQYEGLTCDALEWIAAEDGGTIVESDGNISINNEAAVRALERAQGWVGTITPENVTESFEEDSRAIWQAGNAAFMRNWPYAYSLGNAEDSPIAGLFDAAPLPGGANTLGGWQLGVSKYSKHPEEAVELVRYFTSAAVQKDNALNGVGNPTRRSLYEDPEVLASNPFFNRMPAILDAAVARPSTVTADNYVDVSTTFYTAVHRVLSGELSAQQAVDTLETTLSNIRAEGW